MPHAEQRISAIIDPYLMFIKNIAVSHSRRIYLNSRRLIVVLETCRYVKRYINAFVKIALSYRSLNGNLTTLLKKGDKWALPGRLPEVISKKKKFTCTIQRKTTLAWLKKVLNQMKNKEVLLSNIIHLLKRKRQSDNIHVQQWTIDKMTVFWARGSSPSDTDESSLSLTVACHGSVFFLISFVWVFLSSYRY